MSIFMPLFVAALFVALTPGILVKLPKGGSKMKVAVVHGLIFAVVFYFTLTGATEEGFQATTVAQAQAQLDAANANLQAVVNKGNAILSKDKEQVMFYQKELNIREGKLVQLDITLKSNMNAVTNAEEAVKGWEQAVKKSNDPSKSRYSLNNAIRNLTSAKAVADNTRNELQKVKGEITPVSDKLKRAKEVEALSMKSVNGDMEIAKQSIINAENNLRVTKELAEKSMEKIERKLETPMIHHGPGGGYKQPREMEPEKQSMEKKQRDTTIYDDAPTPSREMGTKLFNPNMMSTMTNTVGLNPNRGSMMTMTNSVGLNPNMGSGMIKSGVSMPAAYNVSGQTATAGSATTSIIQTITNTLGITSPTAKDTYGNPIKIGNIVRCQVRGMEDVKFIVSNIAGDGSSIKLIPPPPTGILPPSACIVLG